MSSPPGVVATPLVELDAGVFKYILVRVSSSEGVGRTLVRGYNSCQLHSDVMAETMRRCPSATLECIGGGRIEHTPSDRSISIYGYSQAYGRADHARAKELCQQHFGDGYNITWNNDGY